MSAEEPTNRRAKGRAHRLCREIESLREAATILKGNSPYRELPRWWVKHSLLAMGMELVEDQGLCNNAPRVKSR